MRPNGTSREHLSALSELLFSAATRAKDLALANVRDLCPINGIRMPHLLHNHIRKETQSGEEVYIQTSIKHCYFCYTKSKTTVVATVYHMRNVPKNHVKINKYTYK